MHRFPVIPYVLTTKIHFILCSEYQPPEYVERRLISQKFDVFSLGVIILRIVAGKRGYSRNGCINHEQFADDVRNDIVCLSLTLSMFLYMQ